MKGTKRTKTYIDGDRRMKKFKKGERVEEVQEENKLDQSEQIEQFQTPFGRCMRSDEKKIEDESEYNKRAIALEK